MSFSVVSSPPAPSTNGEADNTTADMAVQMELHSLYNGVVEKIAENPMSEEAVEIEQQAWVNVMRKYKNHLNIFVANYLMGQLNCIIMMASNSQQGLSGSQQRREVNPSLLYNVHIHLGDLHRLRNKTNEALHFYKIALRIDASRGTVYNQLALCYSRESHKFYERCFYLVLAVDSVNDSVNAIGGKANICKTLARHSNVILDRLSSRYALPEMAKTQVPLPTNGNDWFFLSVLAMHMNDVHGVLEHLMVWLEDHHSDDDPKTAYEFGMMALDSLLDYVYQDRPRSESMNDSSHRSSSGMDHSEHDSMSESFRAQNMTEIALTNNFLLRHFLPLHDCYKKMDFVKERRKFNSSRDRPVLEAKLCHKMAYWNSPSC